LEKVPQLFEKLRHELVATFKLFQLHDTDQCGFVPHTEVRKILKYMGLEPYRADVTSHVALFLLSSDYEDNQEVNFLQFLELIQGLRKVRKRDKRRKMKDALKQAKMFNSHGDVDISSDDVFTVLRDADVLPEGSKDVIRVVIENTETDALGSVPFRLFEDMVERTCEKVNAASHHRDMKTASALGFEQKRLAEFNKAFDLLDADDSGSLSLYEVESAIGVVMTRIPPASEIQAVFKQVMNDLEKEMNFTEFLLFMKLLNAEEKTKLQDPAFRICDVPPEKLRTVLRLFPLAETYIRSVDDSELPELTASFLQVHAQSNLREDERHPVRNMRTLMVFAAKMVDFMATDPTTRAGGR